MSSRITRISCTAVAFELLISPIPALAAGWGNQTTITGYYVWDNGVAYINTGANQNPDGCQSAQYLALETSAANFKAIWAQVIAAHGSGTTVKLYYSGCVGPHPQITAIAIPAIW